MSRSWQKRWMTLTVKNLTRKRWRKHVHWKNVCEKRPIKECVEKTKKPPIKVKWIDHNKGDRQNMNVRSRLVAKQNRTGKEQGVFAATPPLEAFCGCCYHRRSLGTSTRC